LEAIEQRIQDRNSSVLFDLLDGNIVLKETKVHSKKELEALEKEQSIQEMSKLKEGLEKKLKFL
jgi:hypothetical protein